MSRIHVCKENIAAMVLFLACYAVALCTEGIIGCAVLLISAIGTYAIFAGASKGFADLRGLLCLSWEAGLSLAILRLSALHTPWTVDSKISFAAFPCAFLLFSAFRIKREIRGEQRISEGYDKVIARLIYITAIISFLVFIAEGIILGYIPIFSEDTHAYNYFHVSGLHYFTVSAMMTHALTAVYYVVLKRTEKRPEKKTVRNIVIANIVSASVAVMCVSKFQFILVFGLPTFIFLGNYTVDSFRNLKWKVIIPVVLGVIVLGIVAVVAFTALRHYEPGYLQDIFEFNDPDTPVAIQYPYMYVANNFANFNCMTENLPKYTYGMKQLFPVFALTGVKFIIPNEVVFPLYVVKEEINTLTIIYDAYYDFGIVGVIGFGAIMGMLSSLIAGKIKSGNSPIWLLLYGQIAIYFVLSFFSAWFSVPTTWFWFGLTFIYMFMLYLFKRKGGTA